MSDSQKPDFKNMPLAQLVPYAEQGDAEAQTHLGMCYYLGKDIQRDYGQAAEWFLKAAVQGYAEAQWRLGYCYSLGDGVKRNHGEAAKWYLKAVEQGTADAQYQLGVAYRYGYGVEPDLIRAAELYAEASKQGHKYAFVALTYILQQAPDWTFEQQEELGRATGLYPAREDEPQPVSPIRTSSRPGPKLRTKPRGAPSAS